MRLSSLLKSLTDHLVRNERDLEITLITSDSRQVVPGALFVAYPGVAVDGTRFIPEAIRRGAVAIVTETPGLDVSLAELRDHPSFAFESLVTQPPVTITVPSARSALAHLFAAWYDFPSRKLRAIGITGTDGKTTTCTLAAAILTAAGHKVGTITTVAAKIGDREIDTGFHTTTPDAADVQRLLAQMADAEMEYAVIEATSHGLAQRRLDAVDFDVAVVTNITHEHLDIHGSWENYREAKAMLFASLAGSYRKLRTAKVAVLNGADNTRGAFDRLKQLEVDERIVYAEREDESVRSVSLKDGSTFIFARDVVSTPRGLVLTVVTPYGDLPVESPLIGRFNVPNILAAIGVGIARRTPFEAAREGIARVRGVPGRMQAIQAEPFIAMVDFAHTPNALRVALEAGRELARGRVIVVFGCAGLRDMQKRAWMGQVAGKLADKIVITAEDPRTESLEAINSQIELGLAQAGRRPGEDYVVIPDRAEAIARAVQWAQPGDIVMACGKGHERSMCYGTTEFRWSDQEAMQTALELRSRSH